MEIFCEKISESIAYEEYPDGVRVIPHNKLEDILRRYSSRFIIEVKPVLISPEMCLVECRATDRETGETVLKVGESNPANLETEIARKYPGTLAYQRAIDRCVVAILGLGVSGKYYSSHEILCREESLTGSSRSRKKDEDEDFEFVDKFIEELESASESETGESSDIFPDPSGRGTAGDAGEEAETEDGSRKEDPGSGEQLSVASTKELPETRGEPESAMETSGEEAVGSREKEGSVVDLDLYDMDLDDIDDLFDEDLDPEPEIGPVPGHERGLELETGPEPEPEPARKHPKAKKKKAAPRLLSIRRPEEEPDWDDFEEPEFFRESERSEEPESMKNTDRLEESEYLEEPGEGYSDSLDGTHVIPDGSGDEPDSFEADLESDLEEVADEESEFNEFLEESILIGPFIGRKVKEVVSTPRFRTFIKLIVRNTHMGGVLQFKDEARSRQVERFEKFADRLSDL